MQDLVSSLILLFLSNCSPQEDLFGDKPTEGDSSVGHLLSKHLMHLSRQMSRQHVQLMFLPSHGAGGFPFYIVFCVFESKNLFSHPSSTCISKYWKITGLKKL